METKTYWEFYWIPFKAYGKWRWGWVKVTHITVGKEVK